MYRNNSFSVTVARIGFAAVVVSAPAAAQPQLIGGPARAPSGPGDADCMAQLDKQGKAITALKKVRDELGAANAALEDRLAACLRSDQNPSGAAELVSSELSKHIAEVQARIENALHRPEP